MSETIPTHHESEPEMRKFTGWAIVVGAALILAVVIIAWLGMRDVPGANPAEDTPPGVSTPSP